MRIYNDLYTQSKASPAIFRSDNTWSLSSSEAARSQSLVRDMVKTRNRSCLTVALDTLQTKIVGYSYTRYSDVFNTCLIHTICTVLYSSRKKIQVFATIHFGCLPSQDFWSRSLPFFANWFPTHGRNWPRVTRLVLLYLQFEVRWLTSSISRSRHRFSWCTLINRRTINKENEAIDLASDKPIPNTSILIL